ncbi:MAG: glucokinase [Parvibaculum sp.]
MILRETKTASLLVADIGGTNARFALASSRDGDLKIAPPSILQTADYASLDLALGHFLEEAGHPRLAGVAACAAGPVTGKGERAGIAMTNCPWDVTVAALARVSGVVHPRLMNDFEALARSVPALAPEDLHPVESARKGDECAPVGIIGAGTGLGVSALLFDGAREIAMSGEGGHVDLAPSSAREEAVLAHLRSRYDHVSAERVLSGPGLAALHATLSALAGEAGTPLSPVEIATRARAGTCAISVEAVQLFCGWLGAVAGDLALTLGARGGIYIGGGIVPGWLAEAPGLFDEKLFRARFEAKGRLGPWLSTIPVYVIRRGDAALLGLARAARDAG